ncbi:MAG: ATP phosphoribosyltransferase [Pseudomonadota bacterium]
MLNIGIASKGRIQDQTFEFLKTIGLPVRTANGRSYSAGIDALSNSQIWLLPANEIAKRLHSGDLHVGITGHDLLLEIGEVEDKVSLLEPLGFAQADLVVAVPNSWIDVASIADLREVFADIRQRMNRAPQVATKYTRIVRERFLEEGISDFRIVADPGATEAAPLRGIADVIVDITTTGDTLRANDLKPLSDAILSSEAWLAASTKREIWTEIAFSELAKVMTRITSFKDNRTLIRFAPDSDTEALRNAIRAAFDASTTGLNFAGSGLIYVSKSEAFEVASFLQNQTGSPIGVFQPDLILDQKSEALERFRAEVFV